MWDIFPQLVGADKEFEMRAAFRIWPALCGLALLAACGGGSTPSEPPSSTAALVQARPGELAAYLVARLRTRQGSPLLTTTAGAPPPPAAAVAGGDARSTTLVQEAGVDEEDLIKADADLVYTLHAGALRRDRLKADGSLERLQSVSLPPESGDFYTEFRGLHLAPGADRAAVLGTGWTLGQWSGDCGGDACPALGLIAVVPAVPHVLLQPVTLGSTMAAEARLVIDGSLVGTRRIGHQLVIVTTHVPALAVDALPLTATAAEREAALAALTAADLLPTLRIGSAAPVPLVSETECYLQPDNGSAAVEITTITVLDLASPTLARQSRCFVGGSEALYMAPDALYLATTRSSYAADTLPLVYPPTISTDVHKFELAAGAAVYRASGNVTGHLGWDELRKPYRFSAWNGHLRVLTFTGSFGWASGGDAGSVPASPATLTVLRQEGDQLREVSRLPNAQRPAAIGKAGEQVYAVRFVDDRAYVVTFRLIDPLYVLDLSVPDDPRTAGELEVTGFSQDLFPMGSGWLLGVGRETDTDGFITGLKLALFDVRDAAAPKRQAAQVLGGAGSITALDSSRQGLNLRWQDGVARVALPVYLTQPGGAQHGLQRIEVDPAAGTLTLKPLLEPSPPGSWTSLAADRSLQFGDRLVWLSDGRLGAWDW
jgi:Beta propeller domain